MIDIQFDKLHKGTWIDLKEIGEWLDIHMPNLPLPYEQRWTIGYSTDSRVGIRFAEEKDATYFLLRWS